MTSTNIAGAVRASLSRRLLARRASRHPARRLASRLARPPLAPRPPPAHARACVPQDYWVGKAADVDLTDVAAALGDWGWDVTI